MRKACPLLLATLWCLCLLAGNVLAQAPSVLVNGDFTGGLAPWQTGPGIDPTWNPLAAHPGALSLHPPSGGTGFTGLVVEQTVNVSNIAGQQADFAMDIWSTSAPPDRSTVGVGLLYLDTTGLPHPVEILTVANNTVTATATTVNASFTFPADADRLIGVGLYKHDSGEFFVDDISLTVNNATVGAVPTITGTSPADGRLNYGDSLTITGSGFGTTQGKVRIAGRQAGITVTNWSDTQIDITVNDPVVSGELQVFADGVPSNPVAVTILSPHFFIFTPGIQPFMSVIKGQRIRIPLGVGFANGYTLPAGGAITWSLVDKSGAPAPSHNFSPATLAGPGGTVLTVDTSGMAAGTYHLAALASDGTNGDRAVDAWVTIHTVASAQFLDMGQDPPVPVTAIPVTTQGKIQNDIAPVAVDDTGRQLPEDIPITVTSDNPAVVLVVQDPYDVSLYAVGDGTANVTVTWPDGFSASLPVTVTLPQSPRVTINLSPTTVTNRSTGPVHFSATGADQLTGAGWGGSFIPMTTAPDTSNCPGFNNDNTAYDCQYLLDPNDPLNPLQPGGSYALFHATASGGSATATGYALLTVTPDPQDGQVRGRVVNLDPEHLDPYATEMYDLEFYDPTSGDKLFSRSWHGMQYGFFNGGYHLYGIPPGSYLVRCVLQYTPPGAATGSLAQWWPNSPDQAGAQPVTVTAGQAAGGINFFFAAPPATSGFTVSGRVVRQSDSTPYPDPVSFQLLDTQGVEQATATSDANGTFRFTNVPPGSYTVAVVTTGTGITVTPQLQQVTVVDQDVPLPQDYLVSPADNPPALTIDTFTADTTSGTAPLTVSFTCAASGATVTGYDLDVDNDQSPEVTGDPDGSFSHTYQQAGTFTAVCVAHDDSGASAASQPLTITVTDTTTTSPEYQAGYQAGWDACKQDPTCGGGATQGWDCNNNQQLDLGDILCGLRSLSGGGPAPE